MARERRTKKEIITAKIETIEEKITGYANKIAALTDEKEALQAELEELASAQKKAEEEAKTKEVLKLIKDKNISIDDLKKLVENS
ncbi:MAG: hypothetical protein LUF27_12465 [Lachnospiraceae bacterium]|nr:hypothetical protein [Lachnospiraceae bacterium]MCD8075819.1 hypothetical protein [Lachnospiraceae bacterium]